MSMFDNIVFDEFTLLEGEQAEVYKKRKEEEKADKDKSEKERNDRRYGVGSYTGSKNRERFGEKYKGTGDVKDYYMISKKDGDRIDASLSKVDKDIERRRKEYNGNADHRNTDNERKNYINALRCYSSAADAANRNMRRHPKNECTFSTNYLYESSEIDII